MEPEPRRQRVPHPSRYAQLAAAAHQEATERETERTLSGIVIAVSRFFGLGPEKEPPLVASPAGGPAPLRPLARVAVVGAGLGGLTAAYRLRQAGCDVTVFEKGNQPGGALRSVWEGGCLWEAGTAHLTGGSRTLASLIAELELDDQLVTPRGSPARHVIREGRPRALPTSLAAFLATPLLSAQAKLGAFAEPLVWARRALPRARSPPSGRGPPAFDPQDVLDYEDESAGALLRRHMGQEAVDYLLDPVVGAAVGGDPWSLSARYGAPRLWTLERAGGSLLIGAALRALGAPLMVVLDAATRPERRPRLGVRSGYPEARMTTGGRWGAYLGGSGRVTLRPGATFSLAEGVQALPRALAAAVGRVRYNTAVVAARYDEPAGIPASEVVGGVGGWRVMTAAGDAHGPFDAVLWAAPLDGLGSGEQSILARGRPVPMPALRGAGHAPVATVVMAFPAEAVRRPMPGSAVLIPSVERTRAAASHRAAQGLPAPETLYSLSLASSSDPWAGRGLPRAPPGVVTITSMLGGARNAPLARSSRRDLESKAYSDAAGLLGVEGPPLWTRHASWPASLPQYGQGYGGVLRALRTVESDLPGLYFAGGARGGATAGAVADAAQTLAVRACGDLLRWRELSLRVDAKRRAALEIAQRPPAYIALASKPGWVTPPQLDEGLRKPPPKAVPRQASGGGDDATAREEAKAARQAAADEAAEKRRAKKEADAAAKAALASEISRETEFFVRLREQFKREDALNRDPSLVYGPGGVAAGRDKNAGRTAGPAPPPPIGRPY